MGDDLETLNVWGKKSKAVMRNVPGTLSAFSERVFGGNYLDYQIDRLAAGTLRLNDRRYPGRHSNRDRRHERYPDGEGLKRYPVNIRYARDYRNNLSELKRILIATPQGAQIPIAQVAGDQHKKRPPGNKE